MGRRNARTDNQPARPAQQTSVKFSAEERHQRVMLFQGLQFRRFLPGIGDSQPGCRTGQVADTGQTGPAQAQHQRIEPFRSFRHVAVTRRRYNLHHW